MELVGRMLDGSIPYSIRGALQRTGLFGSRVSQDSKIERLEDVPLFEGCTRRQLRAVARIADVLEVPAGTVLTKSGDPGEAFFLILDGRVRIEVSPRKRVRMGPGEFFGEMSLLDGGPRTATVAADTDVRVLVIARRDFSLLLSKVPDLMRNLLVVLVKRLRVAEQGPSA
ncbi:MAG TPA: cyclic nucleotide-binding domain-containing protein [Methylomirabilota bacterium]|jgi:CRP-like cAMP-binding protein